MPVTNAAFRFVPVLAAAGLLVTGAAWADAAPDEEPIDPTPPIVASCTPAHSSSSVPTTARPGFNFSEEMNPATLNSRSFWLSGRGGTHVRGEIAYLGQSVTIAPEAPLEAGTYYTVTVTTGARDRDGNPLVRDYACSFTTVPLAVAVTPAPAPALSPRPAAIVVPAWRERRWYLAPMLAWDFPVCDGCVENGPGWAVSLGKALNDRWNLELAVVDRDLDLKRVPGSSHDTSLGLNLLWFPERYRRFAPFVLGGAGANKQEQDPDKESTVAYGTGGVGFLVYPWFWNATFRMGVQWIRPFGGDYCGKGDTVATVGFQFPFGS
ncbi:MAG TPA: Ig-like domain-containing protein [Solimonas sp.]|nr:Ig-like domain-containing protein [Solimonas sp.]